MDSNWKSVSIGQICSIKRGASPRPIQEWMTEEEGIPWVKISDANSGKGKFINETVVKIKNGGKNHSVEVFPGDLILSNSATPGLPRLMGIYACIHDGWLLLREFKGVKKEYLFYVLEKERANLLAKGNGSIFTNLKTDILREHEISLPPINVQIAIAHILGTLDEKIELNRKTNETLEKIAKAIFKSWFITFDPVRAKEEGRSTGLSDEISELFPDSFEDSELGEIPAGWKISSIGDIAQVIDCLHSKKPIRQKEGELLLQLSNIRDNGILDVSDQYLIASEDYQKWISRLETQEGDCVITNVGRVGAVSQVPPGIKAALGRNMTAVRPKDFFPFPTLILEYLLSPLGRNEIQLNIDVGTILNALNVKSIPKLRIPLPGIDICKHYEGLVRPMRQRMEQINTENKNIALVRDTLLPKLISGEVRIPDAEKMLEEVGI